MYLNISRACDICGLQGALNHPHRGLHRGARRAARATVARGQGEWPAYLENYARLQFLLTAIGDALSKVLALITHLKVVYSGPDYTPVTFF